ncbi:MAG: hypothetical protein V4505_18930 [Pseudomonadota bacterium]
MTKPKRLGLLVLIGMYVAATAQVIPPLAGKPVDVEFNVRQLLERPSLCISLNLGEVSALLPYSEIVRIAEDSGAPSISDENEARREVVRWRAARGLIKRVASNDNTDSLGCIKYVHNRENGDLAVHLKRHIQSIHTSKNI